MKHDALPKDDLGGNALFLVWGPPSHGPRSRAFARGLGIDVQFISSTRRRGLLAAPYKYSHQAVKTLSLLSRRHPHVVFVQSPPSFAVVVVWLYCLVMNARFAVDAHSDAMQSVYWTRPRWLYRYLARRALTTIVTNEYFARKVRGWGGRALIVRDIPTDFPTRAYPVEGSFNALVVNSFATDEPLGEIIAAAKGLEDVVFYVTGDKSRAPRGLTPSVPNNVRFTDYLDDASYYGLMAASQVVICLTTRDHTMQRGACEALSMGKPIITSKWPLLESYFSKGTVHVCNRADEIRNGVREIMQHHSRYKAEIGQLQTEQRRAWHSARDALVSLLSTSSAVGGDDWTTTGGL